MQPLSSIAANLARALRLMPCTCIEIGSWPLFKAEAAGTPDRPGKHVPKKCSRCAALDAYDLHIANQQIVQTPDVAARQVMDSLKEAGK